MDVWSLWTLGSSSCIMFTCALLAVVSLLFVVHYTSRKRRENEPPLIKGWIPFLGKALEFRKDSLKFLLEQKRKHGDIFTVRMAGKYMTFVLDPLLYPHIIKHSQQLDFREFLQNTTPRTFGYPPVHSKMFSGLKEQIAYSFTLLQGNNLTLLTERMLDNLMLVFRQDHLGHSGWRSGSIYQFCLSMMFEATLLTMYGHPAAATRHGGVSALRDDFLKFDSKFHLLVQQVPIWLFWGMKAVRKNLINYFMPDHISRWTDMSEFIRMRMEMFEDHENLRDVDKAAHHFAMLWAALTNSVPATFWAMYYLLSHPEALQVVRQEIQEVFQISDVEFSSNTNVKLHREEMDKLPYLESAIKESFRLSSVTMSLRVVQEDFNLRLGESRSIAVREGDIIIMYPQIMYFDPEIYEEPKKFRFDRYVHNGAEKTDFYKDNQKLKHYLMPFGLGSSLCPGRFFAMSQIKQFLCLMLLYFDLQLEDGQSHFEPRKAGLGFKLHSADIRFRYRLRADNKIDGGY
ncbi:25-hydroxycholesterol 7-alpha-hydroxylase-like [Salarias fasciatus]|uniref:25-hydroxycholesterol 7-alpha-hydroxylase-like n=1 Tax=Salarias fasciatus TaxID=181472 RepID=UPI0011768A54|nr:25-hydroxycholesterol 7-alpha-hydroxylase-like [Salarias fasciatus]